jgi:hypothetical protein
MRSSRFRRLALAAGAVLLVATATHALADEPAKHEATGVRFEPGTPSLSDVLAKAKAASKPAFLDFFTDT